MGTEPPHWPCSQTVRPPVQRGQENLLSTAGTTRSNKAATGDQYTKAVITARCGWGPLPPGGACAVICSLGAPTTLASPAAVTPALGLMEELWLPQGCAGGRRAPVREDLVPWHPGAAGARSRESRGCGEQRAAQQDRGGSTRAAWLCPDPATHWVCPGRGLDQGGVAG